MKYLLYTILFFASYSLIAQIPQAFSYQGIALDTDGSTLKDQELSLRFTIIESESESESESDGLDKYQETQNVTTTSIGHFTATIGRGDILSGSFDQIAWQGAPHFLKVEMDINNADDFIEVGTIELVSVPYAYVAHTADMILDSGRTGPPGEMGVKGPQGPTGPTGPTGEPGQSPPPCIGRRGEKGPKGADGPAGLPGEPGGEKGDTGPVGPKGAKGPDMGPPGDHGPQGPQGEKGPPGQAGPAGPAGEDGPPSNIIGPTGPAGPQGPNGGPDGPVGDRGPKGPKSPDGADGATGMKGGEFYNVVGFNILTSPPSTGIVQGSLYIDDGSNRLDGKPGFRIFIGADWSDL